MPISDGFPLKFTVTAGVDLLKITGVVRRYFSSFLVLSSSVSVVALYSMCAMRGIQVVFIQMTDWQAFLSQAFLLSTLHPMYANKNRARLCHGDFLTLISAEFTEMGRNFFLFALFVRLLYDLNS